MDTVPWWCANLLVMFLSSFVGGLDLPPIYWNSTNEMFKSDNIDHEIHVTLGDKIDIICPYYKEAGYETSDMEYYVIYQVPKEQYYDCSINSPSKIQIIFCKKPLRRRRYTIIFSQYSAIPNAPEFRKGQSYYYISTSTGTKEGLEKKYQGACYDKNMRMKFKVCCDDKLPSGPVSETTGKSTQPTYTTSKWQRKTTKKFIPPKYDKDKQKDIINKDKNQNEVLPNNPSDLKRVSQGAIAVTFTPIFTLFCSLLVTITKFILINR